MKKKRSSVKKRISKPKPKRKILKKVKPKLLKKLVKQQKQTAKKPVGLITHFYDHISVAVVKINNPLKIGDSIKIEGHGKSFKQKITSMQMEHKQIKEAKKGLEIGLKVNSPVKNKDLVFKE